MKSCEMVNKAKPQVLVFGFCCVCFCFCFLFLITQLVSQGGLEHTVHTQQKSGRPKAGAVSRMYYPCAPRWYFESQMDSSAQVVLHTHLERTQ